MSCNFADFADEINGGLDKDERPTLGAISARDLQKKDIPPQRFILEKMLVIGLTILASPPKYGKSWFALNLCLSVASGSRVLGYRTAKTGCLYLALEDSERRIKSRMEKLLGGREAPDNLYYTTMAHDMDNGLFDEMEDFLEKHPDTGLIVIDTLQKVRGAAHGREGAYAGDYREIAALKGFADRHGVALVIIHHLRKMADEDPFNRISGTNGISGAADTMLVMSKEKRNSENATLSITGRDVEQQELVIRFNKDTCTWENLGDAEAYAEQQAQKEYLDSPLRKTILKLLDQGNGEWAGTMKDLQIAGQYIAKCSLSDTSRELSAKIQRMEKQLLECDGIVHDRKPNGNGGGKHRFNYVNATVSNGSNDCNGCTIWG